MQAFTKRVISAYAAIKNERTRFLIQQLIYLIHQFIESSALTTQEWEFTWDFMLKMAKHTHDDRNEFLLMADVLGVSQLIEMRNHQREESHMGYALVGPFYKANAPYRQRGSCIASVDTPGERVCLRGNVVDIETGEPIADAVLDIWQADNHGLYETQDPNMAPMNLRGRFTTDETGSFELKALMPTPYPVPIDGPVGELLRLAKRHPNRPAHIHFIVSSPSHETLVTQVFVEGDPLVESDVVFTANKSMLAHFEKNADGYHVQLTFPLKRGISTYPEAPLK